MKQDFLKKWNITAIAMSSVSAIYFLVKFIINNVDPDKITKSYKVFDIFGFSLLGLALAMLIFEIIFVKYNENKEEKLSKIKDQDKKLLEKYKKKK